MLASSVFSYAQVEVVESASIGQQQAEQKANEAEETANRINAELLFQIQQLQEEMLRMQGKLEEQSHQIQQLKQQRLDDYVNLDKRIAELASKPNSAVAQADSSSTSNANGASDVPLDPNDTNTIPAATEPDKATSDKTEYKAAYALIKQRQFDDAKEAFQAFLAKHPSSSYVANAHYWLGELYILDANYKAAKSEFATVLRDHSEHRKYPESLFKLAKVNYELGERDIAKKQLEQLIKNYAEVSTTATRQAREFLAKHYP